MSEKINSFLDAVCGHVKCKSVHKDIRDELTSHINELKDTYLQETQDEEGALEMAISAMGDCEKIGKHLDKQHRPQTEWSLVGLTAFIALIGGTVTFMSRSWERTPVNFSRYSVCVIIGIVVMIGLTFFDYTKLKKLSWPTYLSALSILAVVLFQGTRLNGVVRFIWIGGSAISVDFTTLLFLAAFAGFVDKSRGTGITAIIKLSVIALISVIPVVMQPNILQALILLLGYSVLITGAIIKNHFGGSKRQQAVLFGAIICFGGLLSFGFLFSDMYRTERLNHWLSIFTSRGQLDPIGMGYQQVVADKLMSSSSIFGAAAENKWLMPNLTTDYALVNVFATLGRISGFVLILAVAVYIFRMFMTTRKIKSNYGFYLSLGACTVLSAQFLTGILVNFNLLPPASTYIPFISYGGVGYIVSMAFIGLMLSAWRRNNLLPSEPKNVTASASNFIKIEDGKLIISYR